MTLIVCKMLSWPFGIILSQQMKILIMISAVLVRNLGVASKGTADYVHKSPIPEAVADAIYLTFEALSDEVFMVAPKIKMRPSMDSFGNRQPRKRMPVNNCRAGNLPSNWPLQ